MTDDEAVKRYLAARVDWAKTLADAYRHHGESPTSFVAGVQYALDKILSQSSTYYNIATPLNIGDVVTIHMLHLIAYEILERAKKGEPQ